MPANYQNGKIYKIVSNQTENIYIGSTIQPLSVRMGGHRSDFKRNLKITSTEIMKYEDNQIILIKLFPCNCRGELEAEERKYIESLSCVNKYIPMRTTKEYQQTNKYKDYKKQYQQTTQYKEKRKKYNDINKEHIKEYYEKNKEYKKEHLKEYYEINKEQIRERQKKQYQQNKEQRLKNQKQSDKFRRSEIGIFIRSFNFKCSCEV